MFVLWLKADREIEPAAPEGSGGNLLWLAHELMFREMLRHIAAAAAHKVRK